MNHAGTLRTRWIVSREFDLSLFFGGAALSLLVLVLALVLRAPIVALWWIWLLAFDGPHIGAAFTRTYLDRQEWTRRPGMLAGQPGDVRDRTAGARTRRRHQFRRAVPAVPRIRDVLRLLPRRAAALRIRGALQRAERRLRDPDMHRPRSSRRCISGRGCRTPISCCRIPARATLIGLSAASIGRVLERALLWGLVAVWAAALRPVRVGSTCAGARSASRKTRISSSPCCCTARSISASRASSRSMARRQGPDQDFLLLSILVVIFHNVQYLGLVWFHNRNRYGESTGHGLAQLVNRSPAFFLGACALFSAVIYSTFACCDRRLSRLRAVRRPPAWTGELESDRSVPVVGTRHEPLLPRSEDLARPRRRRIEAQICGSPDIPLDRAAQAREQFAVHAPPIRESAMTDSRPRSRPERKFTAACLLLDDEEPLRRLQAPVDAKILFRDDAVWFDKFCPDARPPGVPRSRRRSSGTSTRSRSSRRTRRRSASASRSTTGCPFDCGACPSHQQKVYLPVVPDHVGVQPRLPDLLHDQQERRRAPACRRDELRRRSSSTSPRTTTSSTSSTSPAASRRCTRSCPSSSRCAATPGIRRLTISTNGLKLRDEAYVRKLAALDARIVLSLDTFRPETDKILLGANTVKAKLEALDLLEKHDVATTILPAVAAGAERRRGAARCSSWCSAKPHIRSLELHTLTFTGQGGVGFQRTARITIPDLHRRIDEATGGRIDVARLRALAAGASALLLDLLRARASTAAATCRSRGCTSRAKLFELLRGLALHRAAREARERSSAI